MAFNYNPYQYQPQYPSYPSYPQAAQPQQNNGVLWVQGEEGAKAYMVAPGNSVILMDSEHSTFYLKSCDQSGMPSLRVFEYTERRATPRAESFGEDKYLTRKEFEEFVRRTAAKEALNDE